jgi:orotate phosphoribosyltransferase
MGEEDLLRLTVEDVLHPLIVEELEHIAATFDGHWAYDYIAARNGFLGLHAILKSKWHSEGFIHSMSFLRHPNIMRIITDQMVMQIRGAGIAPPDYVIGVPNGATALAKHVAEVLRTHWIPMRKVDGNMVFDAEIPEGARVMCIEDICSHATGCIEAINEIATKHPYVNFVPYVPVIMNRGNLQAFSVPGVGRFTILPIVERRIRDWDPAVYCQLCAMGSEAIEPKASEENWKSIKTSQLP